MRIGTPERSTRIAGSTLVPLTTRQLVLSGGHWSCHLTVPLVIVNYEARLFVADSALLLRSVAVVKPYNGIHSRYGR